MTSAPSGQPARAPGRRGKGLRVLRWLVVVVLAVLLLPYALAPLYRFVDPVSTLMAWSWARGAPVVDTYVPLPGIAPVLPLTVISSEDAKFCQHAGVDWQGLQEAM